MKMVLIGCKICFDDGFVVDFFIAKTDNTNLIAGIVLLLTVLFQVTGKVGPSFILSISRQGVVLLW